MINNRGEVKAILRWDCMQLWQVKEGWPIFTIYHLSPNNVGSGKYIFIQNKYVVHILIFFILVY